ncbi:MAG: hypothetical protein LC725_01070, partial [Lentisphaerae bacterium]|nr:hypothetical protein [Lentisphaerota bacterium]
MLLKCSPILFVLLLSACIQGRDVAPPPPAPVLDWRALPVDDAAQPQYAAWYDFIKLGERRARLPESDTVRDIHPVGDYYPRALVTGQGLAVTVPRAFARPGDRWVELFVELDEEIDLARDVRLDVSLYGSDGAEPLAACAIVPDSRVGMLRVDLRRLDLASARLSVSLSVADQAYGQAQVLLAARAPERPLEAGRRVGISIDLPEGIPDDPAVGLTFSVPFPAGALWSQDGLRLVTDQGREIPAQTEVLGRWGPEGAIQWLRFDCLARATDGLNVEFSRPTSDPGASALTVTEADGRLTLDTGAAVYELARGASPITTIH